MANSTKVVTGHGDDIEVRVLKDGTICLWIDPATNTVLSLTREDSRVLRKALTKAEFNADYAIELLGKS